MGRKGTWQIKLPVIGWIDLAEEPSRLGKLMSATISRHGDDSLVSLSFQREGVKTKREIRNEKFIPKHPRKPGAEMDLRLPHLVNPKRRVLGPVKTVDELIAAATPDDVCGGDRGQRFLITLSHSVPIVRGASDHPVFHEAVPLASAPIPAPPPRPEKLAEPEKPGKKLKKPKKQKRVRRRKAKRQATDFTTFTEAGTQFTAPKPLRKAKKKLARVQRRRSKAALIPLPGPTVAPTPEKLEAKAARKKLREEMKAMPCHERHRFRKKKAERERAGRRRLNGLTEAKRKSVKRDRLTRAVQRKELRKAGRDEEAKALNTPQRKPRKSHRSSKLAVKLSRQHARVVNIRDDSQHKLTTAITRHVKVLCLDHVPGNGGLGAADAALGKMRSRFAYKAALDGMLLIDAYRYFPSSKRCSGCGHIHAGLKRGDTEWTCSSCGRKHDRDINAADNLAWYGRIALCVMKGGESARKALSGLSDEERHWFMVGEAIAEPSLGTTRGEIGSTSLRRTRSGSREEVGMIHGT
jgi:putative transposase